MFGLAFPHSNDTQTNVLSKVLSDIFEEKEKLLVFDLAKNVLKSISNTMNVKMKLGDFIVKGQIHIDFNANNVPKHMITKSNLKRYLVRRCSNVPFKFFAQRKDPKNATSNTMFSENNKSSWGAWQNMWKTLYSGTENDWLQLCELSLKGSDQVKESQCENNHLFLWKMFLLKETLDWIVVHQFYHLSNTNNNQ